MSRFSNRRLCQRRSLKRAARDAVQLVLQPISCSRAIHRPWGCAPFLQPSLGTTELACRISPLSCFRCPAAEGMAAMAHSRRELCRSRGSASPRRNRPFSSCSIPFAGGDRDVLLRGRRHAQRLVQRSLWQPRTRTSLSHLRQADFLTCSTEPSRRHQQQRVFVLLRRRHPRFRPFLLVAAHHEPGSRSRRWLPVHITRRT